MQGLSMLEIKSQVCQMPQLYPNGCSSASTVHQLCLIHLANNADGCQQ